MRDDSFSSEPAWKRWDERDPEGSSTDGGESGVDRHQYRIEPFPKRRFFDLCPLYPFDDDFWEPHAERPEEEATDADAERDDPRPRIEFIPWHTRYVLRHIPLFVVFCAAVLVVHASLDDAVGGVSTLFVGIDPALVWMAAGSAGVWAGIALVFLKAELSDSQLFIKSVTIYGTVITLLAGTAYATYRTLWLGETSPHVVDASAYLLFVLVVGILSYDLVLKGENLFTNLARTAILDEEEYHLTDFESIKDELDVDDEYLAAISFTNDEGTTCVHAYDLYFRRALKETLDPKFGGIRYAHVFAVLLLVQFYVIWGFGRGPLGIDLGTSIAINLAIDFILLVGVFQFLIAISGLRSIVVGEFEAGGKRLELKYRPFHPDGHGGFSDLGRAAMQVNVIIILIGAFFVYRAYMAKVRILPSVEGSATYWVDLLVWSTSFESPMLGPTLWTVNYIGPIFIYGIVAFLWFYYTFWAIHRKMLKAKRELILKEQQRKRSTGSDTRPVYGPGGGAGDEGDADASATDEGVPDDPIGEPVDRDAWEALRDAPVWPVETRVLGWVIWGNAAPLAFSVGPLVVDAIV